MSEKDKPGRVKPDRKPTSQPVKINKERIDDILKDLKEGSTYLHASEANGIAYTTFYWWIRQGQCDLKHGIESLHSYLVKALREIEQEEIKVHKKKISSNKRGHLGSQWILEKCYWKQFSASSQVKEMAEELALLTGESYEEKLSEQNQGSEAG